MSKSKSKQAAPVLSTDELRERVRRGLAEGVIVDDGHGLYGAEQYEPLFPVRAWGLVTKYRSNGTPKGTIFVNGRPVRELEAVWNLSFLEYLLRLAGLPSSTAMGRGTAARDSVDALTRWAKAVEA